MSPRIVAEEKKNLGQKFIAYLPILTLLALGTCILNQIIFYSAFNLDILTYTDVNEIILNTLSSLLKCITVFVISQIITLILGELFIFYRIKKLEITDKNDERLKIKLSFKTANRLFIIVVGILTIGLMWFLISVHNIEFETNRLTQRLNKEVEKLKKAAQKNSRTTQYQEEISLQANKLLYFKSEKFSSFYALITVIYTVAVLLLFTLFYFRRIYETNYFRVLDDRYLSFLLTAIIILGGTIATSLYNSVTIQD